VGVLKAAGRGVLLLESLRDLRVGSQRRFENLDGDDTARGAVTRLEDFRHAAIAELAEDLVVANALQPSPLRFEQDHDLVSSFQWTGRIAPPRNSSFFFAARRPTVPGH
jgi:hypothetical protein